MSVAAAAPSGPIYRVVLPGACIQAQSDLLRDAHIREEVLNHIERRSGDQNLQL